MAKVRELLADEKRWTKEVLARDIRGKMVEVNDPTAVCWCISGAIRKIYGGGGNESSMNRAAIDAAIGKCRTVLGALGYDEIVFCFNDASTTRHCDVLALLELADI